MLLNSSSHGRARSFLYDTEFSVQKTFFCKYYCISVHALRKQYHHCTSDQVQIQVALEVGFVLCYNGDTIFSREEFYFMAPSESSKSAFRICSTISLMCGILGIFSFFYPPIQLIFGSSALILSYLSRNCGSWRVSAIAGIILGILSVICSFVIFKEYMWIMGLLEDPAHSAEIREMFLEYRELIEQALPFSVN